MNRRRFVKSSLAAGVAGAAGIHLEAAESTHFYELRTYELRNDMEPNRVHGFFQDHFAPMMKRLGVGPLGFFTPVSGMNSPSLVVFVDYSSLGQLQSSLEKMAAESEFSKAWKAFETSRPVPYVRYESVLLKAFSGHPKTDVPPASEQGRLFELRTYESKDYFAHQAKVDMFNQDELRIFRESGFWNVFYGQGVYGTRLPHLTYMIAFDNQEARDKAWAKFLAHPDWIKIKDKPGWTNAEAVSNIRAAFLRPTNYSQIR